MTKEAKTGRGRLCLALVLAGPVLALSVATMAGARPPAEERATYQPAPLVDDRMAPAAEERQRQLRERLNQRKAEFQMRLTAARQNQIKNRCAAAQGHLRAAEARIKGVETRRMQAYSGLVDRLSDLSGKLANQGIDTTALEAQLTELEVKIAAFQSRVAELRQAVADLGAMDCAADPVAFAASLQAARTARAAAVEASTAIREHITGTIKVTLRDIEARLGG